MITGRLGLAGQAVSPGAARGRAFHYRAAEFAAPAAEGGDPALERLRLERALEAARRELRELAGETEARLGASDAGILDAQEQFLQDPALVESARARIAEGQAAAPAWWQGAQEAAEQVRAIGEEPWLSRADDLLDVGARVVRLLSGEPRRVVGDLSGRVVLARELLASDVLMLARAGAAGLAVSGGSPTSHAAILARSVGLPMVIGLGEALEQVAEGQPVALDGDGGRLDARPRGAPSGRSRQPLAEPGRAITRDGRAISLWANIASVEGAQRAVRAGAEGVGLLRTEFLYLGQGRLPGELEQAAAYAEIAQALGGRPLVIRTLDQSADKPVGATTRQEANPALGLRGIRASLAQPEAFLAQLRAILRAARPSGGDIRITFPLVSTMEEWRAARELVDVARAGLAAQGVDAPPVAVGCMVEVPGLALLADALAAEAELLSLGTNDLAQYLMAADRDDPMVAALGAGPQPALLRLVERVVAAARAAGKPLSICGELAADPALAKLWVGLGLGVLSMEPAAIPAVREAIALLDAREAIRAAEECLRCATVEQVRTALR